MYSNLYLYKIEQINTHVVHVIICVLREIIQIKSVQVYLM